MKRKSVTNPCSDNSRKRQRIEPRQQHEGSNECGAYVLCHALNIDPIRSYTINERRLTGREWIYALLGAGYNIRQSRHSPTSRQSVTNPLFSINPRHLPDLINTLSVFDHNLPDDSFEHDEQKISVIKLYLSLCYHTDTLPEDIYSLCHDIYVALQEQDQNTTTWGDLSLLAKYKKLEALYTEVKLSDDNQLDYGIWLYARALTSTGQAFAALRDQRFHNIQIEEKTQRFLSVIQTMNQIQAPAHNKQDENNGSIVTDKNWMAAMKQDGMLTDQDMQNAIQAIQHLQSGRIRYIISSRSEIEDSQRCEQSSSLSLAIRDHLLNTHRNPSYKTNIKIFVNTDTLHWVTLSLLCQGDLSQPAKQTQIQCYNPLHSPISLEYQEMLKGIRSVIEQEKTRYKNRLSLPSTITGASSRQSASASASASGSASASASGSASASAFNPPPTEILSSLRDLLTDPEIYKDIEIKRLKQYTLLHCLNSSPPAENTRMYALKTRLADDLNQEGSAFIEGLEQLRKEIKAEYSLLLEEMKKTDPAVFNKQNDFYFTATMKTFVEAIIKEENRTRQMVESHLCDDTFCDTPPFPFSPEAFDPPLSTGGSSAPPDTHNFNEVNLLPPTSTPASQNGWGHLLNLLSSAPGSSSSSHRP